MKSWTLNAENKIHTKQFQYVNLRSRTCNRVESSSQCSQELSLSGDSRTKCCLKKSYGKDRNRNELTWTCTVQEPHWLKKIDTYISESWNKLLKLSGIVPESPLSLKKLFKKRWVKSWSRHKMQTMVVRSKVKTPEKRYLHRDYIRGIVASNSWPGTRRIASPSELGPPLGLHVLEGNNLSGIESENGARQAAQEEDQGERREGEIDLVDHFWRTYRSFNVKVRRNKDAVFWPKFLICLVLLTSFSLNFPGNRWVLECSAPEIVLFQPLLPSQLVSFTSGQWSSVVIRDFFSSPGPWQRSASASKHLEHSQKRSPEGRNCAEVPVRVSVSKRWSAAPVGSDKANNRVGGKVVQQRGTSVFGNERRFRFAIEIGESCWGFSHRLLISVPSYIQALSLREETPWGVSQSTCFKFRYRYA